MDYLNYCLTYLLVEIGEPEKFDLHDFCDSLGLDYEHTENFSTEESIELGRHEDCNQSGNAMIRETLKDLFGKEDILVELKKKYSLSFTLERVPFIHRNVDADKQIHLSLADDIIAFMYKTGTHDDLDYFLA